MVHEKAKSGDPDFDDKVPLDQHVGGKTVTAGDGREVFVSDTLGPINPDGSHASLDEAPDEGDNRPKPGGQATEASSVQVADVKPPAARASKIK